MAEFSGFTEMANAALNDALTTAMSMGHTYVGSEHILCGLLSDETSTACVILGRQGIVHRHILKKTENLIGRGIPTHLTAADFTPRSRKILESAISEARSKRSNFAGTEHLLLALISDDSCYGSIFLKESGADYTQLIKSLDYDAERHSHYSKNSTLMKYGRDLTELAMRGEIDPVIGREDETERVIQILLRRRKNNPCLTGESGVGKTAVAEGVAVRIVSGRVPEELKSKRVFMLDITAMLAGAKYRGDFEERIKTAMDEIIADKDTIVFIDEIHSIVGAGAAEGAVDAANILKPLLARGSFQLIGATTLEEYRRYIEKDAALERRFQPVVIEEPSEETTESILFGLREKYERHHGVAISDEAIKAAVSISVRYINGRFLPDKAIDLIDEASAGLRISGGDRELKRCHIEAVASKWTGIPTAHIHENEAEKLFSLEDELAKEIIGQEKAVKAVANAVKRGRTGFGNPNRPIGSFIFMGATGVGKTQLCKALAKNLFGDEKSLIRFDMSEYMEKHSVSKLIGSPPGYVGFEQSGQLIERIRKKPYSAVLFDEIEKAHPDIVNLLLQVLEDGILTASDGRKASFRNTVIIMTGNVGARELIEVKADMGFGERQKGEPGERVRKELEKMFSPEFLNRVDEIVVFENLSRETLARICGNMLDSLKARAEGMGIGFTFTEEARALLAERGYSEKYGARLLRRTITTEVEDRLSALLLAKELSAGDHVVLTVRDGKTEIEKKESIAFEKTM